MSDNPIPAQPTQPPAPVPATNGDQSGQNPPSEPTWLPERLERAKRSAVSDFLKELGLEKADDLKALLTEAKSLKESQMSDAEKTKSALEKAQREALEAKQRASQIESEWRLDKVKAEVKRVASDPNGNVRAEYPDDILTWAITEKRDLAALIDADGKLDDKGIKSLIEDAKKARPGWFKSGGPGSPSNAGGKAPNADPAKFLEGKRFTF